jgi:putative transposase
MARTRVADVRALVGNGELTLETSRALAERWGVSVRTVWRRVHAYRREGSVRAFLKRRHGTSPGVKKLGDVADEIIRDAARCWWRQTENATIAEIFPTVVGECNARRIAAPSRATVARRLSSFRNDSANFAGEVAAALRERNRLVKGSYTITEPLAVVQIDHTVADVFVVDPISRACIGRPTLTVAIDVATRCVMGFCLSLEAPSALLVALCLEQAVFPKGEWLARIGVAAEWPMHGQPAALHCDNGREFHSAGFRRGCDLNGIDTIYRPPGTPRFGGHIERLIGTLMRRVRLLPGSSYSSDLLGKRPSRAEERAALTIADLRGFLVEDIARYHAKTHRALGVSPRNAWHLAWSRANALPRIPDNMATFRCEFLPLRRRVIGREGIELFNLKYSSEALAPEVMLGAPRVVRFDPRDLSAVYLEREGKDPLLIPLRDTALPPMSLWEWRSLHRTRREVVDRPDGEGLRVALKIAGQPTVPSRSTGMQARRRAARAANWREVQAIAALPAPDVTLEPTMTSDDVAGTFAWEVLE